MHKMKVAIMQPYFLPYIGYFQMIKAVDLFVFYDDVNYIKKGWINRNRILVNDEAFLFTVPLSRISQNVLIHDTKINSEKYTNWKDDFIKTLEFNYKKAPFYNDVMILMKKILNEDYFSISDLAIQSVVEISNYLKLDTKFKISSKESYLNKQLKGEMRIIDVCKIENATNYINAIGGQELYNKENFQIEGIKLNFIKSLPFQYKQFNNDFIPWLSIIDILMFNSIEQVRDLLDKVELF